jgi:hypothetical protein
MHFDGQSAEPFEWMHVRRAQLPGSGPQMFGLGIRCPKSNITGTSSDSPSTDEVLDYWGEFLEALPSYLDQGYQHSRTRYQRTARYKP